MARVAGRRRGSAKRKDQSGPWWPICPANATVEPTTDAPVVPFNHYGPCTGLRPTLGEDGFLSPGPLHRPIVTRLATALNSNMATETCA